MWSSVADTNDRIERRRRVVHAVRAMARNDDNTDTLVSDLAEDPQVLRVVGTFTVAASTLARALAQASNRSVDAVLDELEEGLTSAPLE